MAPGPAADGRLLHTCAVLTPVVALAEITGWPERCLTDAITRLEDTLPSVGLVLHRLGNRVAVLAAGDVDGDLIAVALRSHLNRDGLNLTEIRLLRRILAGDAPTNPTTANRSPSVSSPTPGSSKQTAPAGGRSTPTWRSAFGRRAVDRSDLSGGRSV